MKYLDGQPIKQGDIVFVDDSSEGTIEQIILSETSKADEYGCPSGGLMVRLTDGTLIQFTGADEDLRLKSRAAVQGT